MYSMLPALLLRVWICGRKAGQPQWDLEPLTTRLGDKNPDREMAVIDSRSQDTQLPLVTEGLCGYCKLTMEPHNYIHWQWGTFGFQPL